MEKKLPLIILTGPTAVGKTALSIKLARTLNGEIISADSMQVYRHMDIGSAKIKKEEMEEIPHHLIDILEPWEEFNVVTFQKKSKEAIWDICSRGKIPILTGGAGFYIQSVLYDIDFAENGEDNRYRKELEEIAKDKGNDYLHSMLAAVDKKSAEAIHANNVKRVIRALEYFMETGQKISEHNETERQKESAYNSRYFVLTDNREKIYDRINQRVDKMLEDGLVEEVKKLRDMGCTRNMVSMQGLGYKEILDYLEGVTDFDRAVYLLKRDTRHFAKRQLTWFRREKEVIWVDREHFLSDDGVLEFMIEKCKGVIE